MLTLFSTLLHGSTDGLALVAAHPRTSLLAVLLVIATVQDLRFRRIPNSLVFSTSLLALADSWLGVHEGTGVANTLGGLLTGLALMLPGYLLRAMGGGDVKLMAAVGAVVGFPNVLTAVLGSLIAGGALSILHALRTGQILQMLQNVQAIVMNALLLAPTGGSARQAFKGTSAGRIPYALAIAIGSASAVWITTLPD